MQEILHSIRYYWLTIWWIRVSSFSQNYIHYQLYLYVCNTRRTLRIDHVTNPDNRISKYILFSPCIDLRMISFVNTWFQTKEFEFLIRPHYRILGGPTGFLEICRSRIHLVRYYKKIQGGLTVTVYTPYIRPWVCPPVLKRHILPKRIYIS